jgi:hypothetical protein
MKVFIVYLYNLYVNNVSLIYLNIYLFYVLGSSAYFMLFFFFSSHVQIFQLVLLLPEGFVWFKLK